MKPPSDPILAAFSKVANDRPQTPLVVAGDRSLTASELDGLARSATQRGLDAGLQPGDVIALSASSPIGFLATFLALRRIGCVALLLDSSTRPPEGESITAEMRARGRLTTPSGWPERTEDLTFEYAEVQHSEPAKVDSEIAVIKLTSGSTGRPRGILTPAEALVADEAALARTMELRDDERILAAVPLSHSYGLSSIAMPALVRGSTIVVPDTRTPMGPMMAAVEQSVTFLPTEPASLSALVRLSSPPPLPPSLRRIISAGAALPPSTAARFRERFGQPVHVFYGSSECGGICYDRDGTAAEAGQVGSPVDGVRIVLENGADDNSGSVRVESSAVARSYYPDTSSRLADGRFRSHDLARWEGDNLALVGRSDDLVNVRGRKVNPREVEAVLDQLEGVHDAAVLGATGTGGGEILRAVVACDPELDEATLRRWCRDHLADHKVPRSLVLVDRLPRTARGKLDRVALRRLSESSATR